MDIIEFPNALIDFNKQKVFIWYKNNNVLCSTIGFKEQINMTEFAKALYTPES